MDNVVKDALSLSSGTIAHLTGKRLYSEIEVIQTAFVLFVAAAPEKYITWADAWTHFLARGEKHGRHV